jgi:hypothetical protein
MVILAKYEFELLKGSDGYNWLSGRYHTHSIMTMSIYCATTTATATTTTTNLDETAMHPDNIKNAFGGLETTASQKQLVLEETTGCMG